ncbi:carbohydrate ABC transporter permease [Diplocloster modestus]|uniref:Sugar ABC transporter permease n=1 Tax=Diplocloster modestus TaxID=2850322 RepID=A0ABS6KBF7_9FIRM|nr:sugar ABC transporter permease [Diplocloster modestus]MBU9727859.1 sugar ABC transporter permease [Diplocloster modestus]
MKRVLGRKRNIILFCAPAGILFLSLVIYPIFNIFYLALQKTDGISFREFAGLNNFRQLFEENYFINANWKSLGLALFATVGIALLGTVIAFLTCGLKTRVQRFYKTSYLIPFVLSISVISQLWLSIYHSEWGVLNKLLDFLHLSSWKTSWLSNQHTAMICVAIVGMWWVLGMTILLVYTGIMAVPVSYYEAAKIDGANYWQVSRFITYPLCRNIIKTCIIINTIGGFYTFPQVYVMTKGGPGDLTMTVMMLIYREAFSNSRLGLSCAIAAVTIVESIGILAVIHLLFRDQDVEY